MLWYSMWHVCLQNEVELMPGSGVFITRSSMVSMELAVRKSWAAGFRLLVRAIFPQEVLATHSALGLRSEWPALDPLKLSCIKGKTFEFLRMNLLREVHSCFVWLVLKVSTWMTFELWIISNWRKNFGFLLRLKCISILNNQINWSHTIPRYLVLLQSTTSLATSWASGIPRGGWMNWSMISVCKLVGSSVAANSSSPCSVPRTCVSKPEGHLMQPTTVWRKRLTAKLFSETIEWNNRDNRASVRNKNNF